MVICSLIVRDMVMIMRGGLGFEIEIEIES